MKKHKVENLIFVRYKQKLIFENNYFFLCEIKDREAPMPTSSNFWRLLKAFPLDT